ncbi:molybdopterin-binding protein [uncultured Roseobacter sp.]|uniref:molybdopterin-binding protein n=1 Tax=uncultured Roseobacter sp. TaxID=114847 RepID=UPI002625E5BD|nr:molybdopterin-binding protein [uncultured Roseobacter sp.]
MIFGPVPTDEALGAILAHSVGLGGRARLRKGRVLEAADITRLNAAGITSVVVARPESGDVTENEAAGQLARALVPDAGAACLRLTEPFTGRVNLLAQGPGVAVLRTGDIEAANRVHPMITVATVPQHQQIQDGGMVATIKIISYAVPRTALDAACDLATGAIRLAAPVVQNALLIVTETDGGAGLKGVDAIAGRVAAFGLRMRDPVVVPHDTDRLAQALRAARADLIMILTASATSDPMDTAPEALRAAGGEVARFGMPVDPGNLLFIGAIGGAPVIGLPGCARAPALNGADWVLSRLICGIDVTADDIAGMGVGGLLKEIPSRPQPRAGKQTR